MKWKIILVTTFCLISFSQVNGVCKTEYSQKIKKCWEANIANTTREILPYKADGQKYGPENFVCIGKDPEIFSYQIILDAKFKEIDTKIEDHISQLEENKGYYFGKDKQKSYIEGINNINAIYRSTGMFGKEYYNICKGLNSEIISCKGDDSLGEVFGTGSTDSLQIINTADYFGDKPTLCTKLADKKLKIYKKVSYDILLLNKLAISQDEKKAYLQAERSKYDVLLSKFMINIGYVERIWAKWPAKIKNTS